MGTGPGAGAGAGCAGAVPVFGGGRPPDQSGRRGGLAARARSRGGRAAGRRAAAAAALSGGCAAARGCRRGPRLRLRSGRVARGRCPVLGADGRAGCGRGPVGARRRRNGAGGVAEHRSEVGHGDAGRVGPGEGEDLGHVLVGVVVGQDRADLAGLGGQVAAGGAEVVRRRERRVIDVERVGGAVPVGVDGVGPPRGRDELHRAHGAVVGGVAVVQAVVAVADEGELTAVQRRAEDLRCRRALRAEDGAAVPPVVGLDPADPRQQ